MSWLLENWTVIAGLMGFIGTPIAWYAGRSKEKAKTKIVQGDAVQNMQKAYDTFVADVVERYEYLKKDMKYVKSELSLVKTENVEQRKDLRKSYLEVNRLRKELRSYKEKYTALKAAFDKLKMERDE